MKHSEWWLKPHWAFTQWQSCAIWLLSKAKKDIENRIDLSDKTLANDIRVEEKEFSNSLYVLSKDELTEAFNLK